MALGATRTTGKSVPAIPRPLAAPGIAHAAGSPIGGGVSVDNAVRLFSAYVAYDWHPAGSQLTANSVTSGTYQYNPTVSFIVGKFKPLFAFEEYLGSGNQQFVEYGMTEFFFDADNDNLQFNAGVQVKARDDRLFASALITNGVENQNPVTQLDRLPGLNTGLWYDFGGTWNQERHRWDLYGDTPSNVDYSPNPVVRVGAGCNLVPEDRRSLYGDAETSFYFVMPAGPGGTRLINVLSGFNGTTVTPTNTGFNAANAVDAFDAQTYEAYAAGKYRGFSFLTDWFVRDISGFKTVASGGDVILYKDAGGKVAVFPNHALIDFGEMTQVGYFIVPHKSEIVARVSVIEGESGDLAGPGRATLPGPVVAGTPTVLHPDAFSHYHAAYEYGVGFNYFWHRELLKWSTDISYYSGGNPSGGGSSPSGYTPGVDGWLLRSQIQLAF